MKRSERTRQQDQKFRKWLKTLDPATKSKTLKRGWDPRGVLEDEAIFRSIVGDSFAHFPFVGCADCAEWIPADAPAKGEWARDHRICESFVFYMAIDDIPDSMECGLGDMDLLASAFPEFWGDGA